MDTFYTLAAYSITYTAMQLFAQIVFPTLAIGIGVKFFRAFSKGDNNEY